MGLLPGGEPMATMVQTGGITERLAKLNGLRKKRTYTGRKTGLAKGLPSMRTSPIVISLHPFYQYLQFAAAPARSILVLLSAERAPTKVRGFTGWYGQSGYLRLCPGGTASEARPTTTRLLGSPDGLVKGVLERGSSPSDQ